MAPVQACAHHFEEELQEQLLDWIADATVERLAAAFQKIPVLRASANSPRTIQHETGVSSHVLAPALSANSPNRSKMFPSGVGLLAEPRRNVLTFQSRRRSKMHGFGRQCSGG